MNVKKDNGFDFGDETKVADEAAKVEAEIEQQSAVPPADKGEETVEEVPDAKPAAGDAPAAEHVSEDPPAKVYSQAEVDAMLAKVGQEKEALEQRAKTAEEQFREKRAKLEEVCNNQRKTDDLVKSAYALLGDGHAKIHALVMEMVKLQREVENGKDIQKKCAELKKEADMFKAWYQDINQKYLKLEDEHRELKKASEELGKQYDELATSDMAVREQLESMKTIGDRMIGAFVPDCLTNKEWFNALLSNLQDDVYTDPPSDAAILLLASVAEFAVMERSPAAACFEWKKQLSDIGLVVANYMHQKKVAEGDVVKMLRNFAMALRESPTVAKLKISLKVPEIGPDFNVDEVKHLKNGSAVAKILNWCLIDSNGVFSKAIVE